MSLMQWAHTYKGESFLDPGAIWSQLQMRIAPEPKYNPVPDHLKCIARLPVEL